MKTKLFTALFLLFLCNIAFSQERKVQLYFSAKVSKPCYQKTNLEICKTVFDNDFQVFMPQNIFIPELEFDMLEKCAYEADKAAIDWSDIVFLLSPYGKVYSCILKMIKNPLMILW